MLKSAQKLPVLYSHKLFTPTFWYFWYICHICDILQLWLWIKAKLLELDIWQSSCCGSLNSSEFNFFAAWRWYRTLLIHFLRTSIIPKCVWDIENLMIHTKEFYTLPISQTLPHKLYPREEVETQLGFIAAIFLWILHSISFHGHNITISPSQKH